MRALTYPTIERILAGLSPILYHRTELYSAASILKENQFKLTFSNSSDDLHRTDKSKWFYLSCTRTPLGSYSGPATLVLDGTKMAERYSGSPVDYWGEEFRKVQPDKREFEDRVWSKNQIIPNAKQYIKEVHVKLYSEDREKDFAKHGDNQYRQMLRTLALEAKKSGIPVYFYRDPKAYELLDTRQAITPDFETTKREETPARFNFGGREDYVDGVIKLYWMQDVSDLEKEKYDSILVRTLRNIRGIDQGSGVLTGIHNDKRHPKMESLARVLRHGKFKSVKELLEFIRDKFKDVPR